MLELRIKQGRRHVPIFDLPAYLGRAGAAQELEDTIDGLMAFLDDLSGDPDLEEGGDLEPDDDGKGDQSWPEHHGKQPDVLRTYGREDDEEDDPSGQCTEDEISCGIPGFGRRGAGCTISDPDYCPLERGEKTSLETFYQGCGSAQHEDDDDEPRRSPAQWPLPTLVANDFNLRPGVRVYD